MCNIESKICLAISSILNRQFARTCNPLCSPILYIFVTISDPFTTFECTASCDSDQCAERTIFFAAMEENSETYSTMNPQGIVRPPRNL